MNYYQIYLELMRQKKNQLTEEQIRNIATFLDNENYYKMTKEINEAKVEEVYKVNENITNETIKVNEETVIKVNEDVLMDNIANILLDYEKKPELFVNKFNDISMNKPELIKNIETLEQIIPKTSILYDKVKDVKSDLNNSLKTVEVKETSSFDYMNTNLNKKDEYKDVDFNFSKPKPINIDRSELEPKKTDNFNAAYYSVGVASLNAAEIDLSKPRMNINQSVNLNNENLNKEYQVESFPSFISRKFENIEKDNLTLSGYNNEILNLEDLKSKTNNPKELELYNLLTGLTYTKLIEEINNANVDFQKNVVEPIQKRIENNTLHEINIQRELKRYEEIHKDDNKVKNSSILSLTAIGLLLDNLSANEAINEDEYKSKQNHLKIIEEDQEKTKHFLENKDFKNLEELDYKNKYNSFQLRVLYAVESFKNKEMSLLREVILNESKNLDEKIAKGETSLQDLNPSMINMSSAILSGMEKFANIGLSFNDPTLYNIYKRLVIEDSKIDPNDPNSDNLRHQIYGDALIEMNQVMERYKIENPDAYKTLYPAFIEQVAAIQKLRIGAVSSEIHSNMTALNNLKELANIRELTDEEQKESKRLSEIIKKEQEKYKNQQEFTNLQETVKAINNSLIPEEDKTKLFEALSINKKISNAGKIFENDQKYLEVLENIKNPSEICSIENIDDNISNKSSLEQFIYNRN